MEEEEDAKKVTNHEVFFDDKFPIARRAAATEFLIKAHKFVRCDKREGSYGECSPEGTSHWRYYWWQEAWGRW